MPDRPDILADERTLEALDFASVLERVVRATRTQRGRTLATSLAPSTDFSAVRVEQARTNAARELVASADLHVLAAVDTAELTQAAALGRTLGSSELRSVGDALAAAAAAHTAVREDATLAAVAGGYVSLRELQRAILDGIDERGVVLDRASPALGRIRRSLSQAHVDARDRVGAILKSAKYAKAIQDNVVTIREGRFVVPVKSEFSGEFPGIVHDTSSSGQTLFIEPLAALDANNRVRTLRIEEEREIAADSRRVFAPGWCRCRQRSSATWTFWRRSILLVAKAEVARAMDAIVPELTEAPAIVVENGRHPLLGPRAVPQSLALDESTRLLIISGPNMGGKTVALKMVGLFALMTYCGMQMPAGPGTTIGRFERVLADIGDEQSIATNTSTFSAHLTANARDVGVRRRAHAGARRRDRRRHRAERGCRAGNRDAATVARARGARSGHDARDRAQSCSRHATPGVANASVRFDPQSFKPTFHLDVGAPGQSLAFPLARTIGIDDAIVARAQELLESRERDYETALAELSLRAAELQSEREALEERAPRGRARGVGVTGRTRRARRGASRLRRESRGAHAAGAARLRSRAAAARRGARVAAPESQCVAGGVTGADGRRDAPRSRNSSGRTRASATTERLPRTTASGCFRLRRMPTSSRTTAIPCCWRSVL